MTARELCRHFGFVRVVTKAARLLQVSHQSVSRWICEGIPPKQQARLEFLTHGALEETPVAPDEETTDRDILFYQRMLAHFETQQAIATFMGVRQQSVARWAKTGAPYTRQIECAKKTNGAITIIGANVPLFDLPLREARRVMRQLRKNAKAKTPTRYLPDL